MKRKVLFLFSLLVAFATTLAAKTVPNAGLISSKWEKVCDNYGIWDLVDGVYIYHKSVRTRVPGDKIRCKFKSDGPVTFRLSTKRDVNYMGRLYIVAGRMDTSCNETTTDLEATTIDANDEPITVTYYPTDTEEHSVEFVICTTSPFMDVGQSTCSVMLEKAPVFDFEYSNVAYDFLSLEDKTVQVVAGGDYSGEVDIPASITPDFNEKITSSKWEQLSGSWTYNGNAYEITPTETGEYRMRYTFKSPEQVFFVLENMGLKSQSYLLVGKLDTECTKDNYAISFKDKDNSGLTKHIVTPADGEEHFIEFLFVAQQLSTGEKPYGAKVALMQPARYFVTTVKKWAFQACNELTKVTIGDKVTTIEEEAFQKCTALVDVTLPESLTTLGTAAFRGCTALKDISVPGSVETIEMNVFANCSSLENVGFNEGLTKIASMAFENCTALDNPVFPSTLATIVDYAFQGCTGLKTLTIPEQIQTIYEGAFKDCSSLAIVNYNATEANKISSLTFGGCKSVSTVNIGANVKSIPGKPFYGTSAVKTVNVFAVTPPVADSEVFNSKTWSGTLYVPSDAIDAYKAAYPWNQFRTIKAMESTAITASTVEATAVGSLAYNLSGQQVDGNAKGFVIVGGRKVVKK